MTDFTRYQRQMLLPGISSAGQAQLAASHVLIAGLGALGSVAAEQLVRAGVGRLTLVDRDVVDWTNLHRQSLYDESDARQLRSKAAAAAEHLKKINNEVLLTPLATDLNAGNARSLADGIDLILDGTDNFQTRFLLNDLAVEQGLPLVYGGAVGTDGRLFVVLPETAEKNSPWETSGLRSACLACLFEELPAPGSAPTCETAGVLGSLTHVIASLQAAETIKILCGAWGDVERDLLSLNLWPNRLHRFSAPALRADCDCCGLRKFEHLNHSRPALRHSLCGRHAVQIRPAKSPDTSLDLRKIANRLNGSGELRLSDDLLELKIADRSTDYRLILFPDGRALIHGTADIQTAENLYSRYIGL